MIQNFEDFCRELNRCGFSMGGGNAKGIVNGEKYSNKASMRKIRNTEPIILEYQGTGWKEQGSR